jgi:hypothetical protein
MATKKIVCEIFAIIYDLINEFRITKYIQKMQKMQKNSKDGLNIL